MGNIKSTSDNTMIRKDEFRGVQESVKFLQLNKDLINPELYVQIIVLYRFTFPGNMQGHPMKSKTSGQRVVCIELGARRWAAYHKLLELVANAENFLISTQKPEEKKEQPPNKVDPSAPPLPPPVENPGEEGSTT